MPEREGESERERREGVAREGWLGRCGFLPGRIELRGICGRWDAGRRASGFHPRRHWRVRRGR